ncbi:6-pyruvoyl tetrahydropterin synthase [Vibrio phage 2.117.O._10N.261.45.E9]|nr:6-pyruvoyl tetrahydropterin synthase [Vibrio phage 1.117.O._10N.261.45.E9]AUR95458.1 6-pyruvoyl tetrahydropterin synthase [Vibrio phage 1.207.B._10N.222.51.C2]AUS02349.1 6-pyruvoyl tetrahydropterin synthase [Vibrio phage 2.117.O._10N.261.45.E9]
MGITATRYHDFCAGHRVHGHESKCAHLHGHNYRVYFTVEADEGCRELDNLGRVLDFSVIKQLLCEWLENNWDHKFLYWENDPLMKRMIGAFADNTLDNDLMDMRGTGLQSFVKVPFNPTAENMGQHLIDVVGPAVLIGTGCKLVSVVIEETRKCSVEVS